MRVYQDTRHVAGGETIRQVAMGMNDGVVSIFALLAGIAGAGVLPDTILITLLAAMIAGALSMAAGEFISEKNEREFFSHEIEKERLELKLIPEIEQEEIRLIYKQKGFEGEQLDRIVKQIINDPDRWLKELVIEEIGIVEIPTNKDILKNVLIIFLAFLFGASFSVIPYLFYAFIPTDIIFPIASGVTFGGLFIVGALKKYVTGQYWLKSAIEMVLVGGLTFAITYFIGLAVGITV